MHFRNFNLVAVALLLAAGLTSAQTGDGVLTASYKTPNYKAPRTVDGQPDLQGVWAHNVVTPLERPKEFEGREFLTGQELNAIKRASDELFKNGGSDAAFGDGVFTAALANLQGKQKGFVSTDGKTGDYGSVWLVSRDWTNRTSLIIDPKDGKLPELTERGKELAKRPSYVEGGLGAQAGKRPDGPEDLGTFVRCITSGSPMMLAGYNSNYQIFQSKNYVAIVMERIHDARIIPLDGSPHPPANVKFWLGDSRGHWEGDTLVVDTTNYRAEVVQNNSEKLHVIERFQRTAPNYITYTVTWDDPGEWVKPWTMEVPLRQTKDALYEYACHEGNYGMRGILAGARAADAADAAAQASSK
jgi:hypothetical protein